tara:strand:- start:1194 stop:2792 length:1599 start_codon:yes stop_codon:yes gene_type:complete
VHQPHAYRKGQLARTIVIAGVLLAQLSGCASLTHYNNKETLKKDQAVFIDAKQRAIYSVKRDIGSKKFEGYCAEPSPDTMSVLAASLGVDLSITDKGKLGLSNTIAEGVSNIGIRTAAIQALRDFMYRNCEAYAVGGISEYGLETLQRRFQTTMVGILAIEQLTGAFRVPPVTITSNSSAGSPDAILELTNKSAVAQAALETVKTAETSAKKKAEDAAAETGKAADALQKHNDDIKAIDAKPVASQSQAEKNKLAAKDTESKKLSDALEQKKQAETPLKQAFETAQTNTKKSQEAFDAIEASRVAALTGGGNAETNVHYASVPQGSNLDAASVESIATAVMDIVEKTTGGESHYTEVCTTLLGQHADKEPVPGSPVDACYSLLIGSSDPRAKRIVLEGLLDNTRFNFDGRWSESWKDTDDGSVSTMPDVELQNPDDEQWQPTPGAAPAPPEVGTQVADLQAALSNLGFTDTEGIALETDGIWGARTALAVKKMLYQCGDKLPPSLDPTISIGNLENLQKAAAIIETMECSHK